MRQRQPLTADFTNWRRVERASDSGDMMTHRRKSPPGDRLQFRPAMLDLASSTAVGLQFSPAYGNGHGGDFRRGPAAGRASAAGVGRKSGIAPRLCRRGRQPRSGAWRDARRSLGVFARAGGGGAGANLVPGRSWSSRRIRARSMRSRAIWRSSAMLPVAEFPAWESEPGERVVHDEIYGERLRVLKELRSEERGARSENRMLIRAPRSASSLLDPRHQHSESAAAGAGARGAGGGDAARFASAGSSMSRS